MWCLRHRQAGHDHAEAGFELGTPTGFECIDDGGSTYGTGRGGVGYKLLGRGFLMLVFRRQYRKYKISSTLAYCVYRLYFYMYQYASTRF